MLTRQRKTTPEKRMNPMTKRYKIILGLVLCTGTILTQAKAQYLITINDSNPDAVTFTGTGADATASTSASTYAEGILLDGFTASNLFVPSSMALSTSLVDAVDGTPDYTSAQSASVSGVTGVEISGTSGAPTSANKENFVAGSPAFSGTATFNLNNATFPFVLPANGTIGNVYAYPAGFFPGAPVLLGTYVVNNAAAPEPSEMALLLVGALGLFGVMRARSRGLLGSVLG
jgi:hypothetical protein